ncbi:MAG: hypothetical protein HUU57_09455 [Bdellovibrio sp.]|nr:hypothetical protein [Bdellovibrio sp.]
MKQFAVIFALLVSCSSAFAGWAEDFEILKSVPRSYEDSGSICEEVARIEVAREFPAPQYDVLVGIAYSDGSRVVGELDLVIVDNNLQKVIQVGEVKCWKDVRGGLTKAQEQRSRYLKFKNANKVVNYVSTSTKETYSPEFFAHVKEFFSMAQKGSTNQGFDRELTYTLKEMHDRRYEMIRCQNLGQCARP